ASAGRSRPAEVSGTRAYLAPERREGRETDARSDQFSFCVALYEAVAGRLPRTDSLEVADPWLPAWLRRPLARGLAPRPEDRFPDMPALLSALRQVSDRRRRGLGLVAAAILLSSVVVFAGLERNPSCDGGAASFAATWSTERRVAVQAALQSAMPGATLAEEDLWMRTEGRLDDFARVWGEQYRDACAATHLRGEQSEAMLDRRMLCLEDRRRDFSALLSLLASADAALGGRAPRAVAALASPEICGQRKALPPESAIPADPALASQTNALRGLLAQARAEEAAGRYPQSLEVATAAAEAATELGWPPLLAEAHYQLAIAQGRAGRVDDLRRGLVEAARIAQTIGYGRLLAQAYNSMIIADWLQAQPESARLWGDLAAGVVESLGSPPDLEFERRSYLTNVAEQSGRYDEMLDRSRAALELVADRLAVERGALENNLGLALYRLERRDEAEVWLTRALESLSRDNGPQHPALAAPLHHLAMLNRERGRFDEAWAFHARSLRIGEQAYAAAYPSLLAKLLVSAAETLLAADRIAEARQRSERAVHLLEAEASVNPRELAQARYLLARTLWATGEDRPQAWQLARAAEATLGSVEVPSGDLLAEIEAWLATRHPGA
ncbi:MAG: tetratricopeptide repeat-containing protein kinase family protein, partial [Acidobacteriota bacterium]